MSKNCGDKREDTVSELLCDVISHHKKIYGISKILVKHQNSHQIYVPIINTLQTGFGPKLKDLLIYIVRPAI